MNGAVLLSCRRRGRGGRGGRGGSRRGGGPGGGRGRGAHDAKRWFQGRDHVFTRWNWNAYERLVGISTTQSSYPFLSPAPISITVASLFPHAMAASSALLSRVAWEPKGVTNSIKKLHVPFCCFSWFLLAFPLCGALSFSTLSCIMKRNSSLLGSNRWCCTGKRESAHTHTH